MDVPVPASGGYCVVIPTYNNRATLRRVVEETLRVAGAVIVVDDGCTDGSIDDIADLPVNVVRLPRNRGKGPALRAGFRRALELGYHHAVTLDSDGQHFPEEIPALVEASRLSPDALIIGARDMSGENVPESSHFGRMFSNFWLKIATGVDVNDSQSGFRLYPLRHVTRIRSLFGRYAWECEAVIRLSWGGCPIVPVPVRVYYAPRAERVTHYDMFWDNVRYSALYLYMNFSHLLIPLPHKRLVSVGAQRAAPGEQKAQRAASLWRGIGAGWRRVKRLAALPEDLEMAGGPIARFKALLRYLVRENSTPGELGMAVGVGAFIGCSPWIGIHFLLALYAATRVHLNRIACVAATSISFGPLTAVIAFASIWLGKLLLGQPLNVPRTTDWQVLGQFAWQSLGAWILGSVIIGLAAAFATGLATLYGVRALRLRSRENAGDATAES